MNMTNRVGFWVVGSLLILAAVSILGCSDRATSISPGWGHGGAIFEKGKQYAIEWPVGGEAGTRTLFVEVLELGPYPWVKLFEGTGQILGGDGTGWVNTMQILTAKEVTDREVADLETGPYEEPCLATQPASSDSFTSAIEPATRPSPSPVEAVRGIRWGEKLQKIPGMKVLSEENSIKRCTRNEVMKAGSFPLRSIEYFFYKDRFYKCRWTADRWDSLMQTRFREAMTVLCGKAGIYTQQDVGWDIDGVTIWTRPTGCEFTYQSILKQVQEDRQRAAEENAKRDAKDMLK
jgi:hypothetical protein